MLRSKTALAALGAATILIASTPGFADEPKPYDMRHDSQQAAQPNVRVTNAKPEGESLVNGRNGKTVTLEMVQKDSQWRAETAEMLQADRTSERRR
jgi:hypothetical protein